MKKAHLILALGAVALIGFGSDVDAGEPRAKKKAMATADATEHPKSPYYRKRARVYGYAARRRGGYSYSAQDVMNTYGLTRGLYGSMNSYRDPFVDRQTTAGPFDHGFFFDSGIAPRGGDSPYLH
ncbi:MAG TPA: hypothetical protein VJ233_06685 [Hyphomicrobiaceae bacterium]|nr:hypothetical protein [Hyphomicrobiaceae bacterium]